MAGPICFGIDCPFYAFAYLLVVTASIRDVSPGLCAAGPESGPACTQSGGMGLNVPFSAQRPLRRRGHYIEGI